MVQRSGTVCVSLLEQVEAAVAEYQVADPQWRPSRTDRSVLRPVPPSSVPADPWLADWLMTRRERFAQWAQSSGVPEALDFSPESLGTIEQLIRDRAASVEALRRIRQEEFVQGAVWYVGEVARLHREAYWLYTAPDPEVPNSNPYVGRPFVQQDPPLEGHLMPILELQAAVGSDTIGILAERFDDALE